MIVIGFEYYLISCNFSFVKISIIEEYTAGQHSSDSLKIDSLSYSEGRNRSLAHQSSALSIIKSCSVTEGARYRLEVCPFYTNSRKIAINV